MDSRMLWGTLDMMILDVIAGGPSYGYQIAQTVMSQSEGCFELKEGSLYPALHRLERQHLLASYWTEGGQSPGGRRRKYYTLTPEGRVALKAKREEWSRFAAGISGVLGQTHVVA